MPGGKDSPLGLHLCNLALCEWECTEGEALARLLLLPARYPSTTADPNVRSEGVRAWLLMERRRNSNKGESNE